MQSLGHPPVEVITSELLTKDKPGCRSLTTAWTGDKSVRFLIVIEGLIATLCMTMSVVFSANQAPANPQLHAPTYYLAAEVVGCEPNHIEFRGATNLPAGALVTAEIADFDFDAWKNYSDEIYEPVDKWGFFGGIVRPKRGVRLHRNLVLRVFFAPFRPKQSASVLSVVGKRGEHLSQVAHVPLDVTGGERTRVNPQLIQWSGNNYGLWTMARVPNCGETH